MIQAVMIGITGVFLALFLKQTKPEYAVCISVGTGLLLLLLAAGRLSLVVENIRLIQDAISVQSCLLYTSLYLEQLEQSLAEAQEQMGSRQRLYQSLGIAGGVFLVILLL